ncbi:hypothetical protein OC844_007359 [Tilletia horrida]|nr:hypothetical protein OC844_007359 [Tilletia horrida]
MPKAGIAAGLSKFALDFGSELAKDEDVRKMGRKVMEQLSNPAAVIGSGDKSGGGKKGAAAAAAAGGGGGGGGKQAKSPSSSSAGGKGAGKGPRRVASTSRTYADPGRSRRPGLPHRSSHDSQQKGSPGSGRSSPTGQHRSSRSASYSHHHPLNTNGSPYYGSPAYAHPQLLQPGMPAEYAYGTPSAGQSPLSSPRPSPAVVALSGYPPQHRVVLEARALDAGYGSDGYSSQSRSPSSGYAFAEPDYGAVGGRRSRERSNSVGDIRPSPNRAQQQKTYQAQQDTGSYFAAPAGRLARMSLAASGGGGGGASSSTSGSGTDSALHHRLPAPPSTPPLPNAERNGPSAISTSGGASRKPSASGSGPIYSAQGTSIVVPPHGTTATHALHSLNTDVASARSSAVSAPATPSGGAGAARLDSSLESLSKKDGKKPASAFAGTTAAGSASTPGSAAMTPSQSYDALASSRQRIGAGVPMADVTFAARCAMLIYSLFDLEDTRDYFDSGKNKLEHNPTLLDVVFSDPGKSIKNWALFKRKSDGALVISVRGTSRGPDWVDDMLCHLKEKDYELERANTLRCRDGTTFYAHSSFLRYAVAMCSEVCTLLKRRLAKEAAKCKTSGASSPSSHHHHSHSAGASPLSTPSGESAQGKRRVSGLRPNKLIITGHSSGGAVASLLYLLLEHHYSHILANFSQVFCITFGSAPCVRRTHPLTTRPCDQVLSFILRGDPVPRLDMNYGLYLLDHYKRLPSRRRAAGTSSAHAGPSGSSGAAGPAAAFAGGSNGLAAHSMDDDAILTSGPGHAMAKQTAARDLDGEAFLSRLTELYGAERESERRASADGTLEVPLQDLFPAGEMLMIDAGKEDVWEIDAEKLEATSPVDVDRHEMKAYQRTLLAIQRAQPKLIID